MSTLLPKRIIPILSPCFKFCPCSTSQTILLAIKPAICTIIISSPDLLQSQLWIIDPIDGTVNYARNHQMCAVSIAYAEAGQVRVGAVYCPFLGELFHVIQGEGSYLNEKRLQITMQTELRSALIGTGFPYNREERPKLIPKFQKMLESCGDIRRIGAASLPPEVRPPRLRDRPLPPD